MFWSFCLSIVFFSSPTHLSITSDFEGFLSQILSITLYSYLNFWERDSISLCLTSLVWRGPWLGIELGTSRTWSHHSTTRLSRRWVCILNITSENHTYIKSTIIFTWAIGNRTLHRLCVVSDAVVTKLTLGWVATVTIHELVAQPTGGWTFTRHLPITPITMNCKWQVIQIKLHLF